VTRSLSVPFVLWLLVAPGCGLSADPPDEVTRRFWGAIERADGEAARALASAASGRLVEPTLGEVSIEDVLVGESLRNEQSAMVATTLVTVEEGDELDVTFHTHLVREDGRWKVDLAASRAELRKGLFVAGMREIGEAVGEGVKEIGDAIREGALEMEEALREALEGIDDGSRL
jgi:hypothetical protein